MYVNLYLRSKSLKSIKVYIRFFKLVSKHLNLVVLKNIYSKPINKKRFTVLKSPHVNKCAQEHFGFSLYRSQLTIFSYRYPLLFLLLKYSKSSILFSDIHFKIKMNINNSRYKTMLIDTVNPDNFYLIDYSQLTEDILLNKLFSNIPYYLMLFEIYGELNLNKISKFNLKV